MNVLGAIFPASSSTSRFASCFLRSDNCDLVAVVVVVLVVLVVVLAEGVVVIVMSI